ncbi:hypothetical protein D5S17_25235 [Pseudonocardiaceae bacterium YIM PH 21723]|nr:hypothetical protein D5S17_25235 [Pseudonocardiaceae bacterium YIM PH 21723]
MTRRASLPGAAELFRPTMPSPALDTPGPIPAVERKSSGRQRHETKITVYLSDEELLALEQARLQLRAAHGLGIDRGRIVREAIAVLLADFEDRGETSALVTRLTGN